MQWQLADAKNRFSDLVERALREGPQTVTKRGIEAVVVLSAEEYRRLSGAKPSFKAYLMQGPSFEGLDLERDQSAERSVEL
ncbi:type II toxin-antitoxin system Phd/YefM family antitoxin [Gloeobacter morelensis]|uniref:Antitoxin n=1 Tax=Gloeobacter morelensis MG652769 TaxID=2781736 RepID=A0ABY3PHG7_9CYAN|nr:type II toxin-antitoxin system Phd/YefM family antitoxin [Gloeobacter morelensis]UFP92988.1 type II toxin-antitoxin system Phd/YefM family antitoxin [Gloeobacter morelensis MG652769]